MPFAWLRWTLVAAFALALGHLAWNALLGPPVVPRYLVGGEVLAMSSPDPEHKQLYLRRELFLSQRPRHAWIQVMGRDLLEVYVNGQLLEETIEGSDSLQVDNNVNPPATEPIPEGAARVILADVTPYLTAGKNVIAINVKQLRAGRPPAVAVHGAYLLSDGEHPVGSDESWRFSPVFERGGCWWFATEFKDRHWPTVRLQSSFLQGSVEVPPRARTSASSARWITPSSLEAGGAGLRRAFDIASRPRHAWLRVTATSSYRLAVNGIPLDVQEVQLERQRALTPVQRVYDITPVVQRGSNVVSLLLASSVGPPHLLVDIEVEEAGGNLVRLGSDGQWLSHPGIPEDWLDLTLAEPSQWQPCTVETGQMDVAPWEPRRQTTRIVLPFSVIVREAAGQMAWTLLILLLTLLACRSAGSFLATLQGSTRATPDGIVYLALIPATLAIAGAILATYDPRCASQDVYHLRWVVLAILSVPLQWGLLAFLTAGSPRQTASAVHDGAPDASRPAPEETWRLLPDTWHVSHALLLIALVLVGGWLRLRTLATGPLTQDEAVVYRATMGFLERGFPSRQAHPDLPVQYVQTSELTYLGTGLAALFFTDPCYIVRVPPATWGTLTILLIFLAGRRWFGGTVGLTAAALYTFSPHTLEVANFGRYLSQLQFFTLLTVFLFWQTISSPGALDRRRLYFTTASFLAMYLSWEGSALIVVGMMVAALVQRRGRVYVLLKDGAVWMMILLTLLVFVLQFSHRQFQLMQILRYGTGASEAGFKPMWKYPDFDLWYYFWATSWSRDTLLPLLGLVGAALMAVRHPFRHSARFLLLVLLITCWLTSLFLSVKAWRYGYHLSPFLILVVAAALVAGTRQLIHLVRRVRGPSGWLAYAQAIAVLVVCGAVALGNGLTLQLSGMARLRILGLYEIPLQYEGFDRIVFTDFLAGANYIKAHWQEGDVLIAESPHLVDIFLDQPADYFLQSKLYVPVVLDDRRTIPLHHYGGNIMLPNRDSLADLFARRRRIWYICKPKAHRSVNDADVSAFIRQHMQVAYEDFSLVVLFRGDQHRSANQRMLDENALKNAKSDFLR